MLTFGTDAADLSERFRVVSVSADKRALAAALAAGDAEAERVAHLADPTLFLTIRQRRAASPPLACGAADGFA